MFLCLRRVPEQSETSVFLCKRLSIETITINIGNLRVIVRLASPVDTAGQGINGVKSMPQTSVVFL